MEHLLLSHGAVFVGERRRNSGWAEGLGKGEGDWRLLKEAVHDCFNRVAESTSDPIAQTRRFQAWLNALPVLRQEEGLTQCMDAWLKAIDDRSPIESDMSAFALQMLDAVFAFQPDARVFENIDRGSVARKWVDSRLLAKTRQQAGLALSPERASRPRHRP
jgi:hypothetical protein